MGTPPPVFRTSILAALATAIFGFYGAFVIETVAHGPVHERIARVTRSIERNPGDADAYLIRAELYRSDGDFDAALKDLDHARTIDSASLDIDLARGRCLLGSGRSADAVACFDRVLAGRPDDWLARLGRARARAAGGAISRAAADFDHLLASERRPTPDLYLERARALRAAEDPDPDRILRGLDEGLARLGFLVVLQLEAVDVEIERGGYDAALARLATIQQRSARKERWLARRGEILERAGRARPARAAYGSALAAIERLPRARRDVPATLALESRIQAALRRLEPSGTSGAPSSSDPSSRPSPRFPSVESGS